MNKYFFFIFFYAIIFGNLACRTDNTYKNADYSQLPPEFIRFYETFHADSAFQYSHISFPMEGHRLIRSEKGDTVETVIWTRSNWDLHKRFDDTNKAFKQEFIIVGDKAIIETISAVEGLFKIERRYAMLSSGWNLIYYAQY
ncbi:MAG: hypothetical protein ACM3PT_01285 [Deltaproteobacteria bacterium]